MCLSCFSLSLITCILFTQSSPARVFFISVLVCISEFFCNCNCIGMYMRYLSRLCRMSFSVIFLLIHAHTYSCIFFSDSLHMIALPSMLMQFIPFNSCMHTCLNPKRSSALFPVLLFSPSLLRSFPRMLSLAKLKCSPKPFQFRHNEAAHPLDALIPAPLLLGNPTPLCWSPKTFHNSLCVKLSFRGGFSRCSTVPYPV